MGTFFFLFSLFGKKQPPPFDRFSSSRNPPDDAQWQDISYGSISGAPTRPAKKRTPHRVLDVRVMTRARGVEDFFSCCVKRGTFCFFFSALRAQGRRLRPTSTVPLRTVREQCELQTVCDLLRSGSFWVVFLHSHSDLFPQLVYCTVQYCTSYMRHERHEHRTTAVSERKKFKLT